MSTEEKIDKIPEINIEKVIREKNSKALKFIPRFIINKVKRITHQDEINAFLKDNDGVDAYEFVQNALTYFDANITVKGKEHLPENKRAIFVANHPLGGLDGLVFINVMNKIYGELRFPVNDLLLNLPGFNEIFLPINKHGAHTKQAFIELNNAYESELPILYFPAGLCSRKINGEIVDLEWKKSFVNKAIKHQRDIVPVHITGKNSNFFYNLSNFRKKIGLKANIEMLYLVDEMIKQHNQDITITFGKPIAYESLDKTKTTKEWVEYIREKSYQLA